MGQTAGREWPFTLDVQSLTAGGWIPFSFREFIVKIHSRCDLACDYCYMYEMADQSWRDRPRRMSMEIAGHTAMRIGEHARIHRIPDVTLIMHGGEPLLAGRELISELVQATRAAAGPDVQVHTKVQTNGVGLNEPYLRLFHELSVHVGVSLDGGAEAHDRHRRFASGRGSHVAVAAGLDRLIRDPFRSLFSGLLCTIDLRNEPVSTFKALSEFGPPVIDFLLPHGTWAAPPPGRVPDAPETPYGDWLIRIFDHWYPDPTPRVRLFEEIMILLLGGESDAETVGLSPVRTVVIETDGAIEIADNLKVAFHGAAATSLHVSTHSLDEALMLPGVIARQLGVRSLSPTCRSCPVHQVCGGGLYAHRYRPGTGFYNPSVYCPDLIRLIGHIRTTMQAGLDGWREQQASG